MQMNTVCKLILSLLIPAIVFADTTVITSTKVVESTPTIETSAYAAGDLVGEKITLSNVVRVVPESGVINQVVVTDLDSETVDLDIVFFDTDPSSTTFTDNSAFDIADTDLLNVICVVSLTTHKDFADNGISQAQNVNCPFALAGATTIYAAIVTRSAVTYTSTSDLTLRVGILQD